MPLKFFIARIYCTYRYDFKSARYIDQTQKLIIPKTLFTDTETGNFDGLVVYDINATNIEPSYEIRHILSDDIYVGCENKAYLSPRSFVFDSKLTTILSHSVISTDLETGEHMWTFNLESGSNTTDCAPHAIV